jgi:hypothetical protein
LKRMLAFTPWYAAFLGMGLTLWLFYPGFMSWDSGNQWWQVRHGIFNPAHPLIMVLIWRCTDFLLPGPGGYYIFQTCLYWFSLALFASALNIKPWLKILIVLSLGFWPPLWGLSLHLWKDIGTMSFFSLATAFLAYDYNNAKRSWRLLALACIVLACAYRHNALSAGAVFLVYLVYRETSLYTQKPFLKKKIVLFASVLLIGAVQLTILLPLSLLKQKVEPLWPLQALWDISAVSVHENKLLFPPGWTSPKLTMAILKREFNPSVNVTIFESSLIYVNPYYPMSEQDFAALKEVWLRLPIDHPKAYWQHRWYVSKNLFGWQDPAHPNYVFAPGIVNFKDNPVVIVKQSELATKVQTKLMSITETPVFFGWCYLLLALFGFCWAWAKQNSLAVMLSASALLYVLPLFLLAPSCDFRYLAWLIQGSLLALLVILTMPADKHFKR